MTDLIDMLAATATKHGDWWSPQGTDQCCCGRAVDGSDGWMRHLIEMLLSADNTLVTVKLAPCDTTWPATDDDPGAAVWNTPFGTVAAFDDGELGIEGDTHPLDQVQAYAVALLAAVQAVQQGEARPLARLAPPAVGDQLDAALGIDPEEPTPDLSAVLAEVDSRLGDLVPGDWWIEIGSHDRVATVHVPAEGAAGPTHLFGCPRCGTAAETEIDHADFCAAAPRLLRSLREAVRRNSDAGTASQI